MNRYTLSLIAGIGLLSGCSNQDTEGIITSKTYDPVAKSLVLTVDATNQERYFISVRENSSVPLDALAVFLNTGDRITFPITNEDRACFNSQGLGSLSSRQIIKKNFKLEDRK
ncbi:MAG: hypothetical protein AABX66_01390 [Nanoarchaeota archaeon]